MVRILWMDNWRIVHAVMHHRKDHMIQESNLGPFCCEATVPIVPQQWQSTTSVRLCRLWGSLRTISKLNTFSWCIIKRQLYFWNVTIHSKSYLDWACLFFYTWSCNYPPCVDHYKFLKYFLGMSNTNDSEQVKYSNSAQQETEMAFLFNGPFSMDTLSIKMKNSSVKERLQCWRNDRTTSKTCIWTRAVTANCNIRNDEFL